jgi:hypothetical protein
MARLAGLALWLRPRVRRLSLAGPFAALLLLAASSSLQAQVPPIDGLPLDPSTLKSQVSQNLVRLILDRPIALAQAAKGAASEANGLARDLGARLAAGQGPNGGGVPAGLEVEVGQLAASSAECAQRAQRNLQYTAQDIEVLKGVLGGQLDIDGEPSPDSSFRIVQWATTLADRQRERNESIDACLLDSSQALGRLRAYRSLYPG